MRPRLRLSRPSVAVVLVVAVGVLATLIVDRREAVPSARPPSTGGRRNIVLILTDDQRWDSLWGMPNVRKLLVDHGVTFTDSFVDVPLCCPSRASTLTGEWPNRTGVWLNHPPLGGYPAFHQDHSDIATWLHGAGYHRRCSGST